MCLDMAGFDMCIGGKFSTSFRGSWFGQLSISFRERENWFKSHLMFNMRAHYETALRISVNILLINLLPVLLHSSPFHLDFLPPSVTLKNKNTHREIQYLTTAQRSLNTRVNANNPLDVIQQRKETIYFPFTTKHNAPYCRPVHYAIANQRSASKWYQILTRSFI